MKTVRLTSVKKLNKFKVPKCFTIFHPKMLKITISMNVVKHITKKQLSYLYNNMKVKTRCRKTITVLNVHTPKISGIVVWTKVGKNIQ